MDLHGIQVTVYDSGYIGISGEDRWGGQVDTVYESKAWLLQTLPVLEKSISEEQSRALRSFASP